MLTIQLPQELENEISSLTDNKEAFIIEAIREKIELQKSTALKEDLIKEQSNIFGHKIVLEEFKSTRIEGWGEY
jgi:hypothetical protein